MLDNDFQNECIIWLAEQFDILTTEINLRSVSQWAEEVRYLPKQTTPKPGHFRFSVCPYLKEIVDCFSPDSPVREIDFMKGAQVCATVGVIENIIGYCIDELKSAPVMFLTADGELAKQRIDLNILPMINHSNLAHLIKSSDEENSRKTGITAKRIEWIGGGYLLGFGARNADKLRMQSIQVMLQDEVDAFPLRVGQDGDPQALAEDRMKAYWETRKNFKGSTPLIKGISRIERGFKMGDQRYYFVPCKKCGLLQTLKFQGVDKETGHCFGLCWEYKENGTLDHDSVRYICKDPLCGHAHINEDKSFMLSSENGAKWIATADPSEQNRRSYHLNALYSPVGFYPWSAIVDDWLESWDIESARPRDIGLLQRFYNNNLGESFEIIGDRLQFTSVSPHRRQAYKFKEIPNEYAIECAHSKILLLTVFVDVQKDFLSVAVFGWSKWSTAWVIEYFDIEGETDDDESMFSPWRKLQDFLLDAEYTADDGSKYKIALGLIDSGYRTDIVYRFCHQIGNGFYPSKGVKMPKTGSRLKEFSSISTTLGLEGYNITVDLYKDRWYSALKRSWDNVGIMPKGHFNVPVDITDKQLKELTVESKRVIEDASTKKIIGTEWHRPSGARNELWDLLIGANAALDIIAYQICIGQYQLDQIDWVQFWDYVEEGNIFYTPGEKSA
jgi:terminase, large subunit